MTETMTARKLPDRLEDVVRELEVAHQYLGKVVSEEMPGWPGAYPQTFEDWCEQDHQLNYFVDRIGQHVGELRTLVYGPAAPADPPPA